MIILIGIFGLVFGFIFAYSCESLGWDSFNIVYAIPVLILLNFLSFRGKIVCPFCESFNCGYYYKGKNDEFACCHCESPIAPCEEEDENYEEEN